jgi:hypothetical protein
MFAYIGLEEIVASGLAACLPFAGGLLGNCSTGFLEETTRTLGESSLNRAGCDMIMGYHGLRTGRSSVRERAEKVKVRIAT